MFVYVYISIFKVIDQNFISFNLREDFLLFKMNPMMSKAHENSIC